jgi:hypothetical protein
MPLRWPRWPVVPDPREDQDEQDPADERDDVHVASAYTAISPIAVDLEGCQRNDRTATQGRHGSSTDVERLVKEPFRLVDGEFRAGRQRRGSRWTGVMLA